MSWPRVEIRARRERRQRGRWVLAALIALAAHLLFVSAAALALALHRPPPPVEAEPVTLRPLDAQEWERRREVHEAVRPPPARPAPPAAKRAMNHDGQVVETAPGNDEASPTARFFAEKNNRVQRETQARVKTARPGHPNTPPEAPPPAAEPPPPPAAETAPERRLPPQLIPDVLPLELGPSAFFPPPAAAAPPPSPEERPGEAGGFIDDLSGLAAGDETSLNTRQLAYARWFNEMKRAVGANWHPAQVQVSTHHVLDPVPRVTVVRFTLDRAGTVKDVAVAHPCGFGPYDEEAVRAVRLAGRFPSPPELLFQGEDLAPFQFTFKVEEYWPEPRRR